MGINVTITPLLDVPEISNGIDETPESLPASSESPTDVIENTNSPTNNSSLSEEELANLRQCRNRAYSKVNQKKRMPLKQFQKLGAFESNNFHEDIRYRSEMKQHRWHPER